MARTGVDTASIGQAEVIDDQVPGLGGQHIKHGGQASAFDLDFDMPAEVGKLGLV